MSNKQQSPYTRFKIIMDKAAGNSTADYQGYGRFWNTLSLDQLQTVSIFGVRMIAPISGATESLEQKPPEMDDCCHARNTPKKSDPDSCCHDTNSDEKPASNASTDNIDSASANYPGRGNGSGLIKGLKGEFPYDDSQFTRMPFGGQAVPPGDIMFIENWIDAGCPENQMPTDSPSTGEIDPLTIGKKAHIPVGNLNTYKHEAGELLQRKNAAYLPEDEFENLREAIQETVNLNKFKLDTRSFNAWGKIHGDSCQHGWEQFLPWHRAYLHEFELLLQDFVPGVALPYWDWTMHEFNKGLVPKGGVSGIIPKIYHCWISQQALDNLKDEGFSPSVINKLTPLKNKKFNSGTECIWLAQDAVGKKNWTPELNEALYAQLELTNALFHRYRFPGMYYQMNPDNSYKIGPDGRPLLIGGDNPLANPFHHHYATADEIKEILEIDNWPEFGGGHFANQSFGMLSQNPHNTGHIWSGGQNPMADPTQPNGPGNILNGDMYNDLVAFFDPIAYGHHSNVDRLWSEWQKSHPNINPEDLTDVMVPWQYSVQQLLSISKLGYEYVLGSKLFPINSSSPLTKVKTEETGLHQDIFKKHKKVEIRLHKIRRPVDSHFVRVFVNTPDADEHTPTQDNDHFGGYIARFGHGECVGGVGHCDIPSENRRKFDKRPRHHNTPTNHSFDATKCINKLLEKGVKDFHINIVILNANGQLASGQSRLLMDGVSINFMD
ncbi:MAG: tyrosinase family protein [Flavobacteriales bacterium]|nr:tyrosinase family protein [Flavobacteriales bacterium]